MVQKECAALVRNTFRSQNVERTAPLNHFWELQFFKKCARLWGEACFEVKSVKNAQHSGQFRRCGFCSGFTKNTRRGTGKDSVFVAGGYKNFNKDSLLVAGTVQLTCPVRRSRR